MQSKCSHALEDGFTKFVKILDRHDPKNLAWATDLCGKHRDELGAVHLGVLAAHAALGHVAIAAGGGQNLGAIVTKPELKEDPRIFPIIAAAVPSDLRRLHVGLSLLHHVAHLHHLGPSRIFQAKCRIDLPSNKFWAAAGFLPIAVQFSTSTRGKPLLVWRKRVDAGSEGLETYQRPTRLRMGGGRFVPADKPHLANLLDFSTEAVEWALRQSGARPTIAGWERVDWNREPQFKFERPTHPAAPADPQGMLFTNAAEVRDGRPFFESGR